MKFFYPTEWPNRQIISTKNSIVVDSNLRSVKVLNKSDSLRCECFKTLALKFISMTKLIIIIMLDLEMKGTSCFIIILSAFLKLNRLIKYVLRQINGYIQLGTF